jgi:hypothetical protein
MYSLLLIKSLFIFVARCIWHRTHRTLDTPTHRGRRSKWQANQQLQAKQGKNQPRPRKAPGKAKVAPKVAAKPAPAAGKPKAARVNPNQPRGRKDALPKLPCSNEVGTARLNELGEEWFIDMIMEGRSLREIAKASKVGMGTLVRWSIATPERSARVDEARMTLAQHWQERAEELLSSARGGFALTKARELAHHYRWRAGVSNPGKFGKKVEVTGHTTSTVSLTDSQRAVLDEALDKNY